MHAPALSTQRIRHPLKARLLQVRRTALVTPYLMRVTFAGDDLHDFISASFDDHVKLFFPAPGESRPVMPETGPDGLVFPQGQPRPVARDYTPRRYDKASGELDIEFVLHGDGPAANWVTQAKVGDYLGMGGPRGSFVIAPGFDWHLLIGDETALPAIGRRLEELPGGTKAVVVLEVVDAQEQITFRSEAALDITWLSRSAHAPDGLQTALRELTLPAGEGYVWAAGESASMRAVHRYLVAERGIDKSRIRASSYWRQGDAAVHENLGD
jgi:NADPH-dependent ferric siderophore reductase